MLHEVISRREGVRSMLSFHSQEEMAPYRKGNKGYVFRQEDGSPEDVSLHFHFRSLQDDIICGALMCRDIQCRNLTAQNVSCYNLTAEKIDADNIDYYAVCAAYESFTCRSVHGKRRNARHFCLDGEIEYKKEEE